MAVRLIDISEAAGRIHRRSGVNDCDTPTLASAS